MQRRTGYPSTGGAWLSAANVLVCINFAAALMSGEVQGVKVNAARFDGTNAEAISREILGGDASPAIRDAMQKAFEGAGPTARFIAGLVMGSPDFQKR